MQEVYVTDGSAFVSVGDYAEMTVWNAGSATVYFDESSSVSSSVNNGSIDAGDTQNVPAGQFFVAGPDEASTLFVDPFGPRNTPPAKLARVTTEVQFIGVGDRPEMSIRNMGPQTVYYGGPNVTTSSFTGSIAAGAVDTIGAGQYFVSAGLSVLYVSLVPFDEGTDPDPGPPVVADWFVDSVAGSNTNDGTTVDTPFQTLAKLQTVIGSGESAALKCGSTFTTGFTVPADGITLFAYGEEPEYGDDGVEQTNAPTIDGGSALAGWTAYAGGDDVRWNVDTCTGTSGLALESHNPTTGDNWRKHPSLTGGMVISDANRVRRSGTTTRARYYLNPGGNINGYYAQCDVRVVTKEAADAAELYTNINLSRSDMNAHVFKLGGNDTITLGVYEANTLVTFDTDSFTISAGNTYTLRIESTFDPGTGGFSLSAKIDGVEVLTGSNPEPFVFIGEPGVIGIGLGSSTASTGSNTTGIHIDNVESGPLVEGTPTNTYKATRADVRLMSMNDEYLLLGGQPNTLADKQWFRIESTIYLRSDAGAPANVKTPNITNGIVCNHADVTIQNLTIKHTKEAAVLLNSSAHRNTLDGLTIRNSQGTYYLGGNEATSGIIQTATGVQDTVIENCSIKNGQGDGVFFVKPTRPIVRDSVIGPVFQWGSDCLQVSSTAYNSNIHGLIENTTFTLEGSDTTKGCVIIFGNFMDITDCVMTDAEYAAFLLGGDSSATGNFVSNCASGIIVSDVAPGLDLDNILIARNTILDSEIGIRIKSNGTGKVRTNLEIYNNTVVNNLVEPIHQVRYANDDLTTCAVAGHFQNNILWNDTGAGKSIFFTNATTGGWNSDYNVIGPEIADFITSFGVDYDTLTAHAAATGRDRASFASDHLFVNLGGTTLADYALTESSPARATGLSVSGITDDAVGVPDRGAQEYPTPVVPTLAPSNLIAPSIFADGDVGSGSEISCSPGVWGNEPTSITYQWTRGGSNIPGATSSTYTLTAADAALVIGCDVTATNIIDSTLEPSSTTVTPEDVEITDALGGVAGTNLNTHLTDTGEAWETHPSFTSGSMVFTDAGRIRPGTHNNAEVYIDFAPAGPNYAIQADFTVKSLVDLEIASVVLHVSDTADDAIQLRYRPSVSLWQLAYIDGGSGTIPGGVGEFSQTLVVGNTYTARLEYENGTVRGLIDGIQRVTGTAPAALQVTGRPGVRWFEGSVTASNTTGIHADNILVEDI